MDECFEAREGLSESTVSYLWAYVNLYYVLHLVTSSATATLKELYLVHVSHHNIECYASRQSAFTRFNL